VMPDNPCARCRLDWTGEMVPTGSSIGAERESERESETVQSIIE